MPRPRKAKKLPAKVIQPEPEPIKKPEPQPQPTKQRFSNKIISVRYTCPACKNVYTTTAIGNALVIKDALCARDLCQMRLEIVK